MAGQGAGSVEREGGVGEEGAGRGTPTILRRAGRLPRSSPHSVHFPDSEAHWGEAGDVTDSTTGQEGDGGEEQVNRLKKHMGNKQRRDSLELLKEVRISSLWKEALTSV